MADNNFPTPGGATAPGYVLMWLDGVGHASPVGPLNPMPVAYPEAAPAVTYTTMNGTWQLVWTATPNVKRLTVAFPQDSGASADWTLDASLAGSTTSSGVPFAAGAGGSWDWSGDAKPNSNLYVKGTPIGKVCTVVALT